MKTFAVIIGNQVVGYVDATPDQAIRQAQFKFTYIGSDLDVMALTD